MGSACNDKWQNRQPMSPSPDTATLDEEDAISSGEAVGRVAHVLDPDSEKGLSSGDRAALRRIDLDTPVTPTLWKVLFDLEQDEAPDWIGQTTWEQRWATLLMGMAHCAGLHDYDVPLGQALAEAGWAETRFVRLLEADEETLRVLLRRMAQYLASKQQSANWDDVRQLLFSHGSDFQEDVRLRIARPYYRTLHAQGED